MIKVTMQYARDHFGSVIHASQSQPVIVFKANRAHAVFISTEEYSNLVFLKDLHFLVQGKECGEHNETMDREAGDRALLSQIKHMSEASGVSISDVVRKALATALEDKSLQAEKNASSTNDLLWSLEDLMKHRDLS